MRFFILLLCSLNLFGCAQLSFIKEATNGVKDYFYGGTDNAEPPNPLTEYKAELEIEQLWKEKTGDGFGKQYVNLVPAIGNGKIFTADREGLVEARNPSNGDLLWDADTGLAISAGPGLGRDAVIVGSSNAEVLALNAESGAELWKVTVSSEILSVPKVFDGVVIVRCIDGRMIALQEATGSELWSFERGMPALSLRASGAPIDFDDKIISGHANGKMVSLYLRDGAVVWERTIAIPKGRSEVERMVDLDVDPVERDGVVYVASYQGGIAAVLGENGDPLWHNEQISSYAGLTSDGRYLYVTDTASDIWQLDQNSGASLWKQTELHQRSLTAPTVYQHYAVVGDFEGYVHWLSTDDGRLMARERISDSPIEARPVVVDDIVYVYAKDGTVAALKAH
ncbi:MAG: outer membrane protein assembly factor BamB [Gammaproteobacteria bacterium]